MVYGTIPHASSATDEEIAIENMSDVQDHGRRMAVVRASGVGSVLVLGALAILVGSSFSSGAAPADLVVDSSVGGKIKHDNPSLIHSFAKWTFASSSEVNAIEATKGMHIGFNQYVLDRDMDSWPNYQDIGPTSCHNVQRKWSALRYETGDNNLHWVHDESTTVPHVNISVKEINDMIVEANGDLSEPTQFMDQRYTFATYEIEPYMHMARDLREKLGWEIKFYKTNGDDGMTAWVVMTGNKDGQIFETVAINGPSTTELQADFEFDSCNYIPTKGLNVSREWCADKFDDDRMMHTDVAGCAFFEYNSELQDTDKLGKFIKIEDYPLHQELPMTIPWVTHIMSTEPITDATFFLDYFGQDEDTMMSETLRERETAALTNSGTTHEECDYDSTWIRLSVNNDNSPNTYLHMAYHENRKKGVLKGSAFGVAEYQQYMADIRKNMNDNVYDVFMDNHVGMQTFSTYFAPITMKMYSDGIPLLTRREPVPGIGGVGDFWNFGWEKFSTFFYLPVSYQVFQLTVIDISMKKLITEGLPEYCDWEFCSMFYNWRAYPNSRTRLGKLTTSDSCGFSSETGGLASD